MLNSLKIHHVCPETNAPNSIPTDCLTKFYTFINLFKKNKEVDVTSWQRYRRYMLTDHNHCTLNALSCSNKGKMCITENAKIYITRTNLSRHGKSWKEEVTQLAYLYA
jgi:hypothetical protein